MRVTFINLLQTNAVSSKDILLIWLQLGKKLKFITNKNDIIYLSIHSFRTRQFSAKSVSGNKVVFS
jgi:hypothetical protein